MCNRLMEEIARLAVEYKMYMTVCHCVTEVKKHFSEEHCMVIGSFNLPIYTILCLEKAPHAIPLDK